MTVPQLLGISPFYSNIASVLRRELDIRVRRFSPAGRRPMPNGPGETVSQSL